MLCCKIYSSYSFSPVIPIQVLEDDSLSNLIHVMFLKGFNLLSVLFVNFCFTILCKGTNIGNLACVLPA